MASDEKRESSETKNPFTGRMFDIPKLIQDREKMKQEEYAKRGKIDVEKITKGEFSRDEVEEM